MNYPKITLWVPAGEGPRGWSEVMTWWNMQTPGNQRMPLVPGYAQANAIRITWNDTIKKFLQSDSDYIFSIHNDIIAAPETLMRLLSWGKPLISALVFMRQSPVVPHIWASYKEDHSQPYAMRLNDTMEWFMKHKDTAIKFGPYVLDPRPDDALVEVDFTSTACCLIHRSVLEEMSKEIGEDWFKLDKEDVGGGEDRNFFEHARKAGFPGYVDRSCVVGHAVGEIATSAADFVAWMSVSDFANTGEPGTERKEIKHAS